MAIELATAYVTLTTSARGISTAVEKDLEPVVGHSRRVGTESGKEISRGVGEGSKEAAKTYKSSMSSIVGATAGIFAVGAIHEFFAESITEAKEAGKATRLTAAVIKSTGGAAHVSAGEIAELGHRIAEYSGINHIAVQSAENLLLRFTNVRNVVGAGKDIFNQATVAATNMSVALGRDLGQSAVLVGKALNDPLKGMTALRRVGVQFTDSEKAQVKGMLAHNNVLGAQQAILAKLTKMYGGAAVAGATAGAKMQVAWSDFKEKVGTDIAPLLKQFAEFMTANIIPALSTMLDILNQWGDIIFPLVGTVLAIVGAWKLYTTAVKIATAVQGLFNAVMDANPVVLAILAILALVAAFVLAYRHSAAFRASVSEAFTWVKNAAVAAWHGIVDGALWVWRKLQDVWNAIRTGALWLWTNGIKPVVDAVVKGWRAISDGASTLYNTALKPILDAFAAVYGHIANFVKSSANLFLWLSDKVIGAASTFIRGKLAQLGSAFTVLYANVIAPAWSAIKSATQAVVNAVAAAWNWLYANVLLPVWHAISTAAHALGSGFTWLWTKAIKPAMDAVGSAASWLWGKISPIFDSIMGKVHKVGDTFRDIFGGIAGHISSAFKGAVDAVRKAINGLITLVNRAMSYINTSVIDQLDKVPGVTFEHVPAIPQLATGGLLGQGWSTVGERGAELVYKAGSTVRVFSNSASQHLARDAAQQPVSVDKMVEFSGPVYVRSDQDILELSRGIARETSRRLRSLGVGVSLSGATP